MARPILAALQGALPAARVARLRRRGRAGGDSRVRAHAPARRWPRRRRREPRRHHQQPSGVFGGMPLETLSASMAKPALIYDFWNTFSAAHAAPRPGTGYMALGSHGSALGVRHQRERLSHGKHYLVTGGSGFLGAALCRRLVRVGRQSARSRQPLARPPAPAAATSPTDIEMVVGDIRDPDVGVGRDRGRRRRVHLSAVNGTRFFYEQPELVIDVAIRGIAQRHRRLPPPRRRRARRRVELGGLSVAVRSCRRRRTCRSSSPT